MSFPWGPSRSATVLTALAVFAFLLSLVVPAAHLDVIGDVPGLYAAVLVFALVVQKPFAILVIVANVWFGAVFWIARVRSLATLVLATLSSCGAIAIVLGLRSASPFDEITVWYPGYWLWCSAHAIMGLGVLASTISAIRKRNRT